jgi:transcriptional regulator GlxA family with amidase domain
LRYSALLANLDAYFAMPAAANDQPAISVVRVDILWGPDVLAGAALAVVDVLRVVNSLATMRDAKSSPIAWRWWCADGSRAPQGLPRSASFRGTANMLVVPGWHAQSIPHLEQLVRLAGSAPTRIKRVHKAGGYVAGLFNGASLLGAAGLLQGRKAAIAWPYVAHLLRQAPGVQVVDDRAWVADGGVWTCDSPVQASQVALDMLRHTPLADLALAVAPVVLHAGERQRAAVHAAETGQTTITSAGALERARQWLQTHMAEPYSLQDTARAAATSPRSLLRWFSKVYGQSPLDYLHSLRVAHAQVLLETTYLGVEQIAHMCGYQDVGTFRRVFLRHTANMPATYRERFRLRTSRKRWRSAAVMDA